MAKVLSESTHGGQLDEGHCGTERVPGGPDSGRSGCSKGLTGGEAVLTIAAEVRGGPEKLEG